MTKKDYELIGSAISEVIITQRNYADKKARMDAIDWIIARLENKLSQNDPKFNDYKFRESCSWDKAV